MTKGPSTDGGTRAAAPRTRGILIRRAFLYDLSTRLLFLGRETRFRQDILDLARTEPCSSVLDVGCGTGTLAIAAKRRADKNAVVCGVDASAPMIELARQKADRAGLDIDFRVGLIEKLPYSDCSFDVVLSSLMLHHLPADLRGRGIAEVARVLKPGGRFLAVDLNFAGHAAGHGLLLALLGSQRSPSRAKDIAAAMEQSGLAATANGTLRWLTYWVMGTKPDRGTG